MVKCNLLLFLISIYIAFVQAGTNTYSVSGRNAMVILPRYYKFQDGQFFNFDDPMPTFEKITYDGQDITDWFVSYFIQNNQNGKLQKFIPEIKNTFRPNSNSIHQGEIVYRTHGGWRQNYARFAENQAVNFPASGSFPIIEKVLYGVPGNDIEMTAWFRNYFMQHQVDGKLINHPINFNSIYGDPKPYVGKFLKIVYRDTRMMSTIWLAPPLIVWEGQPMNFPAVKTDMGLDPVVLGATYGANGRFASDSTSKFTKWISQSPRNGVYKGGSVDWNAIFGDPAWGTHKYLKVYYVIPMHTKFNMWSSQQLTSTTHEYDEMVFPPRDQNAFPIIYSAGYGRDPQNSFQDNITEKFIKFFIDNAKETGRIQGRFNWNALFGDRHYGVTKKVVVTYGYLNTTPNTLTFSEDDVLEESFE